MSRIGAEHPSSAGADRAGPIGAACAYLFWGLLPIYFKLVGSVPATQILAHRILWALLLLVGVTLAVGRIGPILRAMTPRLVAMLTASAVLIAINWLVYIWAATHGHVLAGSLGYFINPLVNVAFGIALFGERLRRWQAIAIALAALGVAMLAAGGGLLGLGIALTVALSFGGYGAIRKLAPIDALGGLLIETALLAPLAAAVLVLAAVRGTGAFGHDPALSLELVLAGPLTALPLLLFAFAAKRMRYATIGIFQYITPTMQFLLAVLLFGEPLRTIDLASFGCIWAGCALYAADSLRAARVAEPVRI